MTQQSKNAMNKDSKFFENQIAGLEKEWLTTKEAAFYLGTTENNIRAMACRKQLIKHKPHGKLFFKKVEIDRLISSFRLE